MRSVDQTLIDRGLRYGSFDEHARITQSLKAVVRLGRSFVQMTPSQIEALDMICHKIGGIVNGDPNYDDSWIDIAGYSQLIVNELKSTSEL